MNTYSIYIIIHNIYIYILFFGMIPNPAALENAGNFFHMFYRCDSPLLTIDVQAPTLIMSVTLLAW